VARAGHRGGRGALDVADAGRDSTRQCANAFTSYPIVEVAVLFLAIFLTMIPALDVLTPTYLTFLALAQGLRLANEVVGVPYAILVAISVGAVAMGANTYLGNAPNFMVEATMFVATTLLFFR
jgi:hypothetical protein